MSSWDLMGEKVFYLRVEESLPDYWEGGVLKKGATTTTYKAITGWDEPFSREEAELLPSGKRSKDARWLFTGSILKTYLDFKNNAQLCDKVYLENPEDVGSGAIAYDVYDVEHFDASDNFQLLTSERNYVIIREGVL